ncbi:MAG: outer membrane lipoprotein carrier protein LolA [Candidatus Aminicenantes bacterium]|nr:MAG: outer membrane lipoprotein carrier protein LolA [Candidatus Aminicenantes bacterium]
MKHAAWLVLLSLLYFPSTPEDVALKAEKKLHSLQSIQANFDQIYYSSSMSTPLREKGEFYFKKPELMKWAYSDPEEKYFLYKDGVFLWYVPEDKELIRGALSKDQHEAEILSILSGQKRLSDAYIIEFSSFPSEKAEAWQLKLTSKEEGEYSYILLEIDKKTWLILRAIFFDWAGNKTEYKFTKIKTDVRFSKDMFELKVPPDVEIIEYEPEKKR